MSELCTAVANVVGASGARGPRTIGPWGDGLLEHAIATAWQPCHWHDVSEDELVLFLPALLRADGRTGVLEPIVRRALASHPAAVAMCVRGAAEASAVARVTDSGAGPVGMPLAAAPDARPKVLGRLGRRSRLFRSTGPQLDGREHDAAVLAGLDRLLREITGEGVPLGNSLPPPALDEALVVSVHTGVNGAYFYPRLAFAHELLGTGAWLGLLRRGRSALMPPFVAQVLIDHGPRHEDPATRVLAHYARSAGGLDQLLRMARSARAKGRPVEVQARSASCAF